MIKALLKKEMLELLASLFKNRRNKSTAGKGMIAVFVLLFGFVAITFGFAFYGVAELMFVYLTVEMRWMYFALFGVMAFGIGLIGSVFMTYSALYASKDNDLLLSMPIKPTYILLARTLGLYIMTAVFEALILVPVEIRYIVGAGFDALQIILSVLTLLLLPLFTFVFSALFGYIVALIAPKVKNKSLVSVVLSVIFLGAYFIVYFRFREILNLLLTNAESVGEVMKYGFFPFYALGGGLSGQPLWYLLFAAIAVALFALVYFILQRSFLRLATTPSQTARRIYRGEIGRQHTPARALMRKEFARFFSCPTYILNTMLGVLFIVAATVLQFVNRPMILELRNQFGTGYIALALAVGVAFLGGMSSVTSPSISLEGQSLPILQSLPVSARAILRAKLGLHMILIALPVEVCHAVMCVSIFADRPLLALLTALAPLPMLHLSGVFGLVFNLKNPYLDWANESVAVKQSMSVLFTMLAMIGVTLFAGGVGIFPVFFGAQPEAAILAVLAFCLAVDIPFTLLLEKWGVRKFGEL